MVGSTESDGPSTALEQLVEQAVGELVKHRYSSTVARGYRRGWNELIGFATDYGFPPVFTDGLATKFLNSHGIQLGDPRQLPSGRQRRLWNCVRRLSQVARFGSFGFVGRKAPEESLSADFETILEEYLRFLAQEQGICASSLRHRRRNARAFLRFLEAQRLRCLPEIRPAILSRFLSSQVHLRPITLAGVASELRSFLRYLYRREILRDDLSTHVLRIRCWRHDRLPAVWSPEQIEALLSVVDRSSPVGKRNYAILLLACRLGLRAGDIRALCLEDLRWQEARIAIRQAKTGEPLVLPLSEEIGEALIDYLRHARPFSEHREVFLGAQAPFAPLGSSYTFHRMITRYRQLAGIKVPREGHWGLHSLRHTLATRLLEKGTPLAVIAETLGHRSLDSTRIYTKVDVAALRSAALDPDEVLRG